MEKTIKKLLKTPKPPIKLEIWRYTDFRNGKIKFIGMKNGVINTQPFSTKTKLMDSNQQYKRAFDKDTLVFKKISNVKR